MKNNTLIDNPQGADLSYTSNFLDCYHYQSSVYVGILSFDHINSLNNELVNLASLTYLFIITHLLSNHVHRVLRAAIRDDRDDRRINDAEILDTVDTELRIHNSLLDALGQSVGPTRV